MSNQLIFSHNFTDYEFKNSFQAFLLHDWLGLSFPFGCFEINTFKEDAIVFSKCIN